MRIYFSIPLIWDLKWTSCYPNRNERRHTYKFGFTRHHNELQNIITLLSAMDCQGLAIHKWLRIVRSYTANQEIKRSKLEKNNEQMVPINMPLYSANLTFKITQR